MVKTLTCAEASRCFSTWLTRAELWAWRRGSMPCISTDAPRNLLSSALASRSSALTPSSARAKSKTLVSSAHARRSQNSPCSLSASRMRVSTSCTPVTLALLPRNDREVVVLLEEVSPDTTRVSVTRRSTLPAHAHNAH